MNEYILQMKNITKVFAGVRALDNVSFNLRRNEIHALVGENGAGKSTLMKILLGLYKADIGKIIFNMKEVAFRSPDHALNSGISMIHQEISMVQEMSVAENIWLGRERLFSVLGIINHKKRYMETKKILERLHLDVDPNTRVSGLSVAMMQMLELARAVSYDADIIIMDEPTSALTAKEIELLFSVVRDLALRGVAVIFISHKLEEIFAICDRVTVLRNGRFIKELPCHSTEKNSLVRLIVGRELTKLFYKTEHSIGDNALEVREISSAGVFRNISFKVRHREIVGFYGLMGAGRTEIMNAVFGLEPFTSGEIYLDGKLVSINSPMDAMSHGMAMVTEDRLRMGMIFSMSVMENTTLANFRRVCMKYIPVYRKKSEIKMFTRIAGALSVKYTSPSSLVGQLSGGNQQKVLVSRWLLTNPGILIMDEPTRGIDVGAKAEIYRLIDKLADEGMAVILVSSELPEVISMSDRIYVIRNGEIVYECTHKEADQVSIVARAFGGIK